MPVGFVFRNFFVWSFLFTSIISEAVVRSFSGKKSVLKNFCKIHRKKFLPESLLSIKFQGPATLLRRRLRHRCFLVNVVKFLRTPFL